MFQKPLATGTVYYAEQADDADLGVTNGIKTYSGIVGYGNNNKLAVNDDGSIDVNPKALTQAYDSILTYPRGTDPVRRITTGAVAAFPCKIAGILIEASTSGTITLYDSPTTTANLIMGPIAVTTGQSISIPHVRFYNGIWAVYGGTVAADFFIDPTPLT